jgi:hypothetical protein
MSSCKSTSWLLAALCCCSGSASAGAGYVIGIYGEADNAGGRALGGFVDYGVTEKTWLSAALARTNTGGVLGGLETLYADAAIEHSFGLFGARVGAAYWGDDDILDSTDLRASVFLRGDKGSLSFDFERRDFDFVFSPLFQPDQVRTAEFTANGLGGAGSIQAGDNARLFASGMVYDYSRDLRLQPSIDSLRLLSSSRLSLMNSLIDYRTSGGVEFRFGQRALDITFSRWQTAIDGGKVNSVSFGFVTPSGPASDLELRIAVDESENFGSTFALAVSFYFFGP